VRSIPSVACRSIAFALFGKKPARELVIPTGRDNTTSQNTPFPPQRMRRGPPAFPFLTCARYGVAIGKGVFSERRVDVLEQTSNVCIADQRWILCHWVLLG
jgi:hypothetical protein